MIFIVRHSDYSYNDDPDTEENGATGSGIPTFIYKITRQRTLERSETFPPILAQEKIYILRGRERQL